MADRSASAASDLHVDAVLDDGNPAMAGCFERLAVLVRHADDAVRVGARFLLDRRHLRDQRVPIGVRREHRGLQDAFDVERFVDHVPRWRRRLQQRRQIGMLQHDHVGFPGEKSIELDERRILAAHRGADDVAHRDRMPVVPFLLQRAVLFRLRDRDLAKAGCHAPIRRADLVGETQERDVVPLRKRGKQPGNANLAARSRASHGKIVEHEYSPAIRGMRHRRAGCEQGLQRLVHSIRDRAPGVALVGKRARGRRQGGLFSPDRRSGRRRRQRSSPLQPRRNAGRPRYRGHARRPAC